MTTPSHKQHYRLSPSAAALYVGPEGEVIVQLSDFLLRVQDGITPGGFVTVSKSYVDTQITTLHTTIDAEITALSVPQYAADTGSVNAYVCTLSPALVAHTVGKIIEVLITNTNTGPSTLNPGPGVKAIHYMSNGGRAALQANMLVAGQLALFCYDGTQYELVNLVFNPSGTTNVFVSLSGGTTLNHFSKFGASGNLIDSGQSASGGAATILTISGSTAGAAILQLDGSGNAVANFVPTGNTNILTTWAGGGGGDFTVVNGSGNLANSGFSAGSFDAAGAAAAALASANAHSDALAAWTWSGGTTLALGVTTFTHNLGVDNIKSKVVVVINCTSADAGYSVGDCVTLTSSGPANASNNIFTVGMASDGNSSFVVIGVGVSIANKGTAVLTNLTLAKWNLYIGVLPHH